MIRHLFCTLALLLTLCVAGTFADEKKVEDAKTTTDLLYSGRSLDDWVGDLQSTDLLLREEAIEVLGSLGSQAKPAVAELTKLLKDDNLAIRGRAAIAVWKITGEVKPSLTPLKECLKSPQPLIRREVVTALGMMGQEAATTAPALVELLSDPDTGTRNFTSTALSRMGRSALPSLLEALKSKDVAIRRNVASHLVSSSELIDTEELPALKARLEDEDLRVRIDAARLLWLKEQTDKAILDNLASGIKGNDNQVRSLVLGTLWSATARPKSLIVVLEPGLKSEDVTTRVSVARLLYAVEKKPERVLPIYLALIKDNSPRGNLYGVFEALGELGVEARPAIKPLLDMLKLKDYSYGYEIRGPLAKMGDAAIDPMIELIKDTTPSQFGDNSPQESAVWVLSQLGEKSAAAVTGLLRDKEFQVKYRAANVLAMIGPPAKTSVPKLIEALADTDTKMREKVIQALGNIGPDASAAVPKLVELARDKESTTRTASLRALAQVKPEARVGVPLALEGLNGTDAPTKSVSLELLHAVEPDHKELLPHAVNQLKAANTRAASLKLLTRLGPKAARAVPGIVRLFEIKTSNTTRRLAAGALGAIGPEAKGAAEALAKQLEQPDESVNTAVLLALKQIKPEVKTFLPQVLALLKDPKRRTYYTLGTAIALLGEYGSKAAESGPMLLAIVKDPTVATEARGGAAVALVQVDSALAKKEALPLLHSLMKAESLNMLFPRAILLLDVEDKAANAHVEDALKAKAAHTRSAAALGVGALGTAGKKFVPQLRELVKDKEYHVRSGAAFALWKVTDESKESLAVLEEMLKEEKPNVASSAAYHLGEMGPAAKSLFTALLPLRKSRDAYTRSSAEAALKKIDPEEAAKLGIK